MNADQPPKTTSAAQFRLLILVPLVAVGLAGCVQTMDHNGMDHMGDYLAATSFVQSVPGGQTPSIAADPHSGIVYAAYTETTDGLTDVYVMASHDEGMTYMAPVRVNLVPGNASTLWNTIPIRFGPNGEVYVAWMILYQHPDFPWGATEIRVSKSTDHGQTFQAAVNPIPGAASERAFFDLAVNAAGKLTVSYLDTTYPKNQTGPEIIDRPSSYKMVTSSDGGNTWSAPITLDNQNCVCCQTVSVTGPDGETYFAWRDLLYEGEVRPASPDDPYYYGNTNGTIDHFNENERDTVRDIIVKHTTDQGAGQTFTAPVAVGHDNWFVSICPDAGPGMSFDSAGRLHVAWFTGSDTAPKGRGYYYAYSDDKGATFSEPVGLANSGKDFFPPTMTSVAVDGHDRVWITFTDQRSPDIVRLGPMKGDEPARVYVSVLDHDGKLLFAGPVAGGAIARYNDMAALNDKAFVSWQDGSKAQFATRTLAVAAQ